MNGVLLTALILVQAPSTADDLESYKAASFEWRICTMNAARTRAWASDQPAEAIVDAAFADCRASREKLQNVYETATAGKFTELPPGETSAWRARMIAGIPNVRARRP